LPADRAGRESATLTFDIEYSCRPLSIAGRSQYAEKKVLLYQQNHLLNKIGITKIFCYNNKMFGSINKTFGCCGFVAVTKNLFVVPNFVAVTKPFFSL